MAVNGVPTVEKSLRNIRHIQENIRFTGESFKLFAISLVKTRITGNNTPPAFRQISAPRGVTHFWGGKK